MSNIINDLVLVSAIQDLVGGIKSEVYLSNLTIKPLKITEASLYAESANHQDYL